MTRAKSIYSWIFPTESAAQQTKKACLAWRFTQSMRVTVIFMCIIPPLTHAGRSYLDSPWTIRSQNRANQASEQMILEIAQPYGNHNGGSPGFRT